MFAGEESRVGCEESDYLAGVVARSAVAAEVVVADDSADAVVGGGSSCAVGGCGVAGSDAVDVGVAAQPL